MSHAFLAQVTASLIALGCLAALIFGLGNTVELNLIFGTAFGVAAGIPINPVSNTSIPLITPRG